MRFLLALIVFASQSATLRAQDILVHAKPVRLYHLMGTIVDQTGIAVPYTTIELRDPKDHHVLASTFGDGKGKFLFDDKKYGKRLEIRISGKGFDSAQYTIVLKRFGQSHLRAVLSKPA